jgi:tetratricopeptide (TPR) repeat protein
MRKSRTELDPEISKSVGGKNQQTYFAEYKAGKSARREKKEDNKQKRPMPTYVGILIAAVILLTSAGTTVFLLTQAPDNERLFKQGEHELANGQYAFAVKTLDKAVKSKPNEPKLYLALARAYIGVDQLDKAWECIDRAQQLGLGVVAEPELASDLANYYRQRGQYEKAANLLRPLAKAHLPGKVAELSDLDALWGDECLRNDDLSGALKCWEEVQDLKEGSRFVEAEARLATIYQRIIASAITKGEDSKALDYLNKVNSISQNPKNYQQAASIYEHEEKFDLAIDQIRKAQKITPDDQALNQKLASLLLAYGKSLLNKGDSDSGYAYLQQASSVDSSLQPPAIALRNLSVGVDPAFRLPRLAAEAWNATAFAINDLTVKAEFWDKSNNKLLWSNENHLVDEFVAPLNSKQSKPFEFVATQQPKSIGQTEFRIYLNGVLYDSYQVNQKSAVKSASAVKSIIPDSVDKVAVPSHPLINSPDNLTQSSPPPSPDTTSTPQPGESTSVPKKSHTTQPEKIETAPDGAATSEEKTMKDLDY